MAPACSGTLLETLRRRSFHLDGTETLRITADAPCSRSTFELSTDAMRDPAALEGMRLPRGAVAGLQLDLLLDRMPLGLGLGLLARAVTWLAEEGELRVVVRDVETWMQGLVSAELDERSAGFARLQSCAISEAWGAQSLTFVLEAFGLEVAGTKAYWDPVVNEPRVEVTAVVPRGARSNDRELDTTYRIAAALLAVLRGSSSPEQRHAAWRDLVAMSGVDPVRLGGTLKEPPATEPPCTARGRPAPANPVFSIVVLTYNGLDDTRRCLESVEAHSTVPYELIVVDNDSRDGTPAYLQHWAEQRPHVRVVLNRGNRGFAGGNNAGLALAEGQYAILLNNDAVVTPGWLEGFRRAFDSSPKVGLVGPRSNCVSGLQEVEEARYVSAAQLERFAVRWSEDHQGHYDAATRLVGFCLGVRRAVWEKIGGLDDIYGRGNYEDDDYCLRALAAGFQLVLAHDVFIHHTGGRSFRGLDLNLADICGENADRFRRKWGLPRDAPEGVMLSPVFNAESAAAVPLPFVEVSHTMSARVYREADPRIARDALFCRAQTARAAGHLVTSLYLFAEVARRDPSFVRAHLAYAAAALALNDARHTRLALEGACKAQPQDAQLWTQLAMVHFRADNLEDAQDACAYAMQLEPSSPAVQAMATRLGMRRAG